MDFGILGALEPIRYGYRGPTVVSFGGIKSCMQLFGCMGVGTAIFHVVQGLTVVIYDIAPSWNRLLVKFF